MLNAFCISITIDNSNNYLVRSDICLDRSVIKRSGYTIQNSINIFNVNYSLLGVIHHAGSTIKSGHYYCTVKNSTFVNINDDRVSSQQMSV